MDGSVLVERYGFWLDVTNKSEKPMIVMWPEARYVDEMGKGHEVFAKYAGGSFPDPNAMRPTGPPTIDPGELAKFTIFPIYKSYWTAGDCRGPYIPFREPLVPTRMEDKNPDQMKAYVTDLAKRQVPVKLIVPMKIDGERYEYTFTFVLRSRWSDPTEAVVGKTPITRVRVMNHADSTDDATLSR